MTTLQRLLALGAGAFLLACGTTVEGQQAAGTHRVAGEAVAIFNIAGAVTVAGGGSGDVTVEVRPGGAAASQLTIAQGEVRGRQAFRVLYPDDQIVYAPLGRGSSTTLNVARDGTFDGGGSGRRRVEVRGSGRGLDAHADLSVTVPAGRSVVIHQAVGSVIARNVEGHLVLDVHSASVMVDGMRGELLVDAGSGTVTVADVRGDVLELDTGSGEVSARGVAVRQLRLDTGSGGAELDGVSADRVELDTGSGDVVLGLDTDVELLEIDSGSGNVTVRAPASLGGELSLDTGSGELEVDFPLQVTSRSEDHLSGRIGDGAGRIWIDTGSGDVRLLRR